MSKAKTVSTINVAREEVLKKAVSLAKKARKSFQDVEATNSSIRAWLFEVKEVTGVDFRDITIGTDSVSQGKNKALGCSDVEAMNRIIQFALSVREYYAEAKFANYDEAKIKELGGKEKAKDHARGLAKTWWKEAIKDQKNKGLTIVSKNGKKVVKGKVGKLAKNGKVVDLVEVADQQAQNYINALQALVELGHVDADLYRDTIKNVKAVHGFE
jgi:hypothetical protein